MTLLSECLVKQAAVLALTNAVVDMGKGLAQDVKNVVKQDLKNNTYTLAIGGSETAATPLLAGTKGPSVGITASASVSLSSHGQVALNGSIGPMTGVGGGLTGGAAIGLSRSEGNSTPVGLATSYTNHVEADLSVPETPVTFGLGADWNRDGASMTMGSTRISTGKILFLGAGKQYNATYTFNKANWTY